MKNKKMQLLMVGTGGALSQKFGNSQIFIQSGQKKNDKFIMNADDSLMFDCGESLIANLARTSVQLSDIRNVIISHMHSDHVGGLSSLGIGTYFNPSLNRPNLFAPRPIMNLLWPYLSAGLETLAEGQLKPNKNVATFDDFFNPTSLKENDVFEIGGVKYQPFQTIHVVNGSIFMDSYGISFTSPSGTKVVLTGDTQFAPHQLTFKYEWADVIIHDCETSPFLSGVHAHESQLRTLDPQIMKKIYPIHYGDEKTKEIVKKEKQFAGWLFPGDVLEI